jgi:hypothetical protein
MATISACVVAVRELIIGVGIVEEAIITTRKVLI